jgi:hypothetical protein
MASVRNAAQNDLLRQLQRLPVYATEYGDLQYQDFIAIGDIDESNSGEQRAGRATIQEIADRVTDQAFALPAPFIGTVARTHTQRLASAGFIDAREWGEGIGAGVVSDVDLLQDAIDGCALTAVEYAGSVQEEYKRARYRLFIPDGTYVTDAPLYVYEGSHIEFAPRAHLKMASGSTLAISAVNRPSQTNPNTGIEGLVLVNARVDMNFQGNSAFFLQSLRECDIIRPHAWNLPQGTFSYDDGSGYGSVSYPKAGMHLKGRSITSGGCYYNTIHKASFRNEPNEAMGQCGLWIGTTAGGNMSYPNDNHIERSVGLNQIVGIDLDNGNDNHIDHPEVSNSLAPTGIGTIGIRVGNPANSEAAKRNQITRRYVENLDTGAHLTTASSATVLEFKGSESGTTTPVLDEGTNTTRRDGETGSGSARFYQREIRGVTQIQFAASQQASSDVNTLDDYEEGTFLPTIRGLTTAGTGTYTTQAGTYTKIGRVVFYGIELTWTAHDGVGNMTGAGLPFTPAAGTYAAATFISNLALTAGNTLQAYVNGTTGFIVLAQVNAGVSTAIPMDTAATLRVAGHYIV